MASLVENVAAVKKAQEDIDAAIVAKGGTTAGGLVHAAEAIATIPSGGPVSVSEGDVNFYLPDGTRAYAYSKEEFLSLDGFPAQPELEGLVAQEWNYQFPEAQRLVDAYGKLDIGGSYVTDDGATRLYLHITDDEWLTQPLRFGMEGSGSVEVDWGDGSDVETYTHTHQDIVPHTYPGRGDYVISIRTTEGASLMLQGAASFNIFGQVRLSSATPARVYSSRLTKIEFGSAVQYIGDQLLQYCCNLTTVVIPSHSSLIGTFAFSNCLSLRCVVIPMACQKIGTTAFGYCRSLERIVIPANTSGETSPGTAATSMFTDCSNMRSVIVPGSFGACGDTSFKNCQSMSSVVLIGGSIIYTNAFADCYVLTQVTFGPHIGEIRDYAFARCYGVAVYDFTKAESVPVLSSPNVFDGIAPACRILVPSSMYNDWITSTNWRDPSIVEHIVGV